MRTERLNLTGPLSGRFLVNRPSAQTNGQIAKVQRLRWVLMNHHTAGHPSSGLGPQSGHRLGAGVGQNRPTLGHQALDQRRVGHHRIGQTRQRGRAIE